MYPAAFEVDEALINALFDMKAASYLVKALQVVRILEPCELIFLMNGFGLRVSVDFFLSLLALLRLPVHMLKLNDRFSKVFDPACVRMPVETRLTKSENVL